MHNPDLEAALGRNFSYPEAQQIVKFLNRGFSEQGEMSIFSVFIYAHGMYEKTVEEILAACEGEWVRNWGNQDPEERGDLNASGGLKLQNLMSLVLIYQKLGIPNPGASDINDTVEVM